MLFSLLLIVAEDVIGVSYCYSCYLAVSDEWCILFTLLFVARIHVLVLV